MLNYIILAALLVVLTYSTTPTCADNPVLPLLKTFIQGHDAHMNNPNRKHKKEGEDGAFDGASFITAYETNNGAAVNDLTKCTGYNSGGVETKKTCCSNDLVSLFPKLTRGFFRRRLEKPPKAQKLFRTITKFGKKCGATVDETETKTKIQEIMTEYRTCQKKAVTAEVNLIRGTLCSVCVPPSDFATYFNEGASTDQLQIKVVEANLASYDSQMQEGLSCFDTTKAKLDTLINTIISAWDQTACERQIKRVNQIVAGEASFGSKSCRGSAKPLKDEGCLKEMEDDDSTFSEESTLRRFLQQTGGYVVDAEGLDSVYEVDTAENYSLNGEDFPVEGIDGSEFDGPEENSSIILKLSIGVAMVFSLLI